MAKHCHVEIMKMAKEFAGVFYDEAAHDNELYNQLKRHFSTQAFFIEQNWPKFVPAVRTTLAKMLGGSYPEQQKTDIMDILTLDRSIPKSQRL